MGLCLSGESAGCGERTCVNLFLIFGSGAVGKTTVGQELMKITDSRLFHNHAMIEPVLEVFGY